MSYNIITEEFESIHKLLKILDKRDNNSIMSSKHSSQEHGDASWYGTKSYSDAIKLFEKGYSDILDDLKTEIKKTEKLQCNNISIRKSRPKNAVAGFVPNVPNAIRGLPESMILIDKTPKKIKAIEIIYNMHGCASEDTDFFIKSGAVLLSAINLIEKMGVQVKLTAGFFSARCDDEITFPTVVVKHYNQPLDLLKLCFPLAHPSMFRRIGFKYLETCPELTDRCWSHGYGHTCDLDILKKEIYPDNDKIFLLDNHWIRENDYDVEKVLEYCKIV